MTEPKKIKVGIVGGAGYTGGELLRLLLYHPHVEIAFVQSNSQAHKPVPHIHDDLTGLTDLEFTAEADLGVDCIFICVGHGRAKTWMEKNNPPSHCKIIDLSHDFRLHGDHLFIYGLPEVFSEKIRGSHRIANPGCFATAIQLGLVPLANQNLIREPVHIHAITGSTGAGQSLRPTTHFSWRAGNVSIYKAFQHQHLGEIKQTLSGLQIDPLPSLHFVPVRGNFTRGILASMYTRFDGDIEQITSDYRSYYQDFPAVVVTNDNPHLKQVVNTNQSIIAINKYEDQLHIVTLIDNLLKGAGGQAVQNMNLVFELPINSGLNLKPSAF